MPLLSQIQENIRKSGSQDPELLRFIETGLKIIESDKIEPPKLIFKKKELKPKKMIPMPITEPEPILTDTSKIYMPKEKGTPGRKRKRGRKKEGSLLKARVLEELPQVPLSIPKQPSSFKKAKISSNTNDCLKAIINYLQMSDHFYHSIHDCNDHNKKCSTIPLIKKDYMHTKQEVKRQCKI